MKIQDFKSFLWFTLGALTVFTVILLILKFTWPSKEYSAIQSVIENLSDYRKEIESWGYQVGVFDPVSGDMSDEDDSALINYAEGVYDPVLILTDQTGGRWYFYNGFDQYAQETECIKTAPTWGGSEEVQRIVTEFQLFKAHLNHPPLKINCARPDKRDYYDMEIELTVSGYSLKTGKRVYGPEFNHYFTNYCSNNFKECRHFGGLDPVKLNNNADREIKKRFTAEQLSELYRQGLALQDKLMALVQDKISDNGSDTGKRTGPERGVGVKKRLG